MFLSVEKYNSTTVFWNFFSCCYSASKNIIFKDFNIAKVRLSQFVVLLLNAYVVSIFYSYVLCWDKHLYKYRYQYFCILVLISFLKSEISRSKCMDIFIPLDLFCQTSFLEVSIIIVKSPDLETRQLRFKSCFTNFLAVWS